MLLEFPVADQVAIRVVAIERNLVESDKGLRAIALSSGLMAQGKFTAEAKALQLSNRAPYNAYYVIEQSGYDIAAPTASRPA